MNTCQWSQCNEDKNTANYEIDSRFSRLNASQLVRAIWNLWYFFLSIFFFFSFRGKNEKGKMFFVKTKLFDKKERDIFRLGKIELYYSYYSLILREIKLISLSVIFE